MSRIALIRHGKTSLNSGNGDAEERIRGWAPVQLNQEGVREADRLGHEFAGKPVTQVISSPLERARDTAIAISKTTGAPMSVNIALMPWHLGDMTGEIVRNIIPLMNWHVEHEDEPVRNGEPFSAYRKRFLGFLKRKTDELASMPDVDILALVTHSRGLQITKAWLANGAPDDLTINVHRMLDYKAETCTGGVLWLADSDK